MRKKKGTVILFYQPHMRVLFIICMCVWWEGNACTILHLCRSKVNFVRSVLSFHMDPEN